MQYKRSGHLLGTGSDLRSEPLFISRRTDASFFDLRPNDLLKFEVMRWGRARKERFVLGGGYARTTGSSGTADLRSGTGAYHVASRARPRKVRATGAGASAEAGGRTGTGDPTRTSPPIAAYRPDPPRPDEIQTRRGPLGAREIGASGFSASHLSMVSFLTAWYGRAAAVRSGRDDALVTDHAVPLDGWSAW
jgi:hypothetical protein